MNRTAEIKRTTKETDVYVKLDLDNGGKYDITTDCGFFNHMLELFSAHSGFSLTINCKGDTNVDMHHSVEDVGITLGQAIKEALGDKRGIERYASIILPMDEALVMVALDISGRSYLNFDVKFPDEYKVGDMDVELIEEFLIALTRNAEITLHIKKLYGSNVHHIAEAIFKGLARALKAAVNISGDKLPSTKGVL